MKIRCPHCQYTREMPEERVPDGVVVATCPQCGQKFRFSRTPTALEAPASGDEVHAGGVRAGEGDIPPGAIIPPYDPATLAHEKMADSKPERKSPQDIAQHQKPAEGGEKAPDSSAVRADQDEALPKADTSGDDRERDPVESYGDPGAAAPENWGRIPKEEEGGRTFNPWERAPQPAGYLSAFYQTCIRVMFAPARFFAGLRETPLMRPLAFYLLLCVLQIVMQQVWSSVLVSFLAPMAGSDQQMQKLVTMLSTQNSFALTLILKCAMLTLQLYVFAWLLALSWRILAPGHSSFSVIFQILAYAEAPGILCLVPFVGSLAGFIWGLWCMLVGCREALKLSWTQTVLGFIPVLLLVVPTIMEIMARLEA